jgi:hypothetical protein
MSLSIFQVGGGAGLVRSSAFRGLFPTIDPVVGPPVQMGDGDDDHCILFNPVNDPIGETLDQATP